METGQGTMTGTTGTTHGTRDTGRPSPSREVTLTIEINNDIVTGGIPETRNTPLTLMTDMDRFSGVTEIIKARVKTTGEDDVREHRFGYNDYKRFS